MDLIVTAGVIIVVGLLLLVLTWRLRAGKHRVNLRPISGYGRLLRQVSLAVESGRQIHLTLGQGSLVGRGNPASVAALAVLDRLAKDGYASGAPPLVTLGEGTLLPAAQSSVRRARTQEAPLERPKPGLVQFVAPETDPFAYAGGAGSAMQQAPVISNVMMGRFGLESGVIMAVAGRQNLEQVVGTDDPTALALATAFSDEVVVGEELFAAGAYLKRESGQVASLLAQDILRLLIIIAILGLALYQLFAT